MEGILIAIYVALKPIYLRASGTLQICDVFLIIVSLYLVMSRKGRFIVNSEMLSTVIMLAVLCLYQLLINMIWTAVTGTNLLRSTLYYIFNLIALVDFLLIGGEIGLKKFNNSIMAGALISLVVTLLGLVFAAGTGRGLGFFNNPNQLGYYGLIIFTCILFCSDDLNKILKISMIVMSIWTVIASSSKAAFIGVIITATMFIFCVENNKSPKIVALQLLGIVFLGIMIYVFFFSTNKFVLSNRAILMMRRRILNMSTENDTALGSGRGYDRIKEIGINILWGVGEGAYNRFQTMHRREVHSTYAALIVSYGLIGLLGYVGVYIKALRKKGKTFRNLAIFSGVVFYQFSHNGIRNTLLWLLLAVILISKFTDSYYENIRTEKVSYEFEEIS